METVSNIVVGRAKYSLVSGSTEARCPNGQHHNFWSTSEPAPKGKAHWRCKLCGSEKVD